jgi:hypothetical protein
MFNYHTLFFNYYIISRKNIFFFIKEYLQPVQPKVGSSGTTKTLQSPVGTRVDLRFTPGAHQQSLAIGPSSSTCEVDAVSLEAAKRGGCRIVMSTSRGISSGSITTIIQHSYINYQLGLSCATIDLI